MREVKAKIDKDGKVSIEFTGFIGDECVEEREQLRKILLDLGVVIEAREIRKKSERQLLGETGSIKRRAEEKI
jgi:hypothetical protein